MMNKFNYNMEEDIISKHMHYGIVETLIFIIVSVSCCFMTLVVINNWLTPADIEVANYLLHEKFLLNFSMFALWFVSWVLVYYSMRYGFIVTTKEFVFGVNDSRYIYSLKLKDIKGCYRCPVIASPARGEILIYDKNDNVYGPINSYASNLKIIQEYFVEKDIVTSKPTNKEYNQKLKEVKLRRKKGDELSVVKKPYFYERLFKKLPIFMLVGTLAQVLIKHFLH